MNEEIKKEYLDKFALPAHDKCHTSCDDWCDGKARLYDYPEMIDDLWEWFDKKLKERYSQGAKDAIEAVKMKCILTGNGSEYNRGRADGWVEVIQVVDLKAQQFIDSLEKESSHS